MIAIPQRQIMADITIDFARSLYQGNDAAHDFDHVLRVTHLAVALAEAEGADTGIVRTAGLLHDCANRQYPDHHLAGAERARALLKGEDPAFIAAVAHCIEAHRFSAPPSPQTLEAKCLCDADRLDAIGAIGIARVFAFAGHHGNRLWTATLPEMAEAIGPDRRAYRQEHGGREGYTPGHEYLCKLYQLHEEMYTTAARDYASDRHRWMAAFFARLDDEAQGLR